MRRDTVRQVLVVIATLATIVVNGLANALPLNNLTTGEISDRFDVYFVPAGYVFSIWGLIYVTLIAYTIYQSLRAQAGNPLLRGIAGFYLVASAANIAWIFLWHYEVFPATLIAMLVLLLSLIGIYLRLGTGLKPAGAAERWLVRVPFSIYLGWITVATVANVTALLDYWSWSGWGLSAEAWAIIMLAVGGLVAALMALTRRDLAYVLVIVWAYAGIAYKWWGTAPEIALPAVTVAGLVVVVLLLALLLRRPRVVAGPA